MSVRCRSRSTFPDSPNTLVNRLSERSPLQRVRTKKFWIAMVAGCALSAVTWISSADTDPATVGTQTSELAGGVILAVWVGLIIHSINLNRDYLRWRATRTEANAWYSQPVDGWQAASPLAPAPFTPAPAVPVQPPVPAHQAGFASWQQASGARSIDADQYFAQANPAQPVFPQPTQSPTTPPTATPTVGIVGPVDANSASAAEIARAVRDDVALAQRIVAARGQHGGFRDLDDLVALASVQPHELMRLRGKVTFGPLSAAAAQEPGGVSEQQSPSTPTQPGGRVLDF